jgi:hypothetical protein
MAIRPEQFAILKLHLEKVYVPHLPKLLQPKTPDEDLKKNIDRSFAAFAIDHICQIDPKRAARSVVDDFDDYGIDAIYYHARTKTLYLVQAKLKDTSSFSQKEALAFNQGIRKIVNGDYSGFNQNILNRESQIRSRPYRRGHSRPRRQGDEGVARGQGGRRRPPEGQHPRFRRCASC